MSCYLISEVAETLENPIQGWCKSNKPETYNLLLPTISRGRPDNVLDSVGDPQQAVDTLIGSTPEAPLWPSSCYNDKEDTWNQLTDLPERPVFVEELKVSQKSSINCEPNKPERTMQVPLTLPEYCKYRPPSWAYDTDPKLLEAARSLFFERKKQMIYETSFSNWSGHRSNIAKIPSDYELFIAWAGLTKAEKFKYISEVNGGYNPGPGRSQFTLTTLETERAVNALYTCSADATSWPSFQYLSAHQMQHTLYPTSYTNPFYNKRV